MSFAVGDIVLLKPDGACFRIYSVASVTLETSYGFVESKPVDASRLLHAGTEQCKEFYEKKKKILKEQLDEIAADLEVTHREEADFLQNAEKGEDLKSGQKKRTGTRKKTRS